MRFELHIESSDDVYSWTDLAETVEVIDRYILRAGIERFEQAYSERSDNNFTTNFQFRLERLGSSLTQREQIILAFPRLFFSFVEIEDVNHGSLKAKITVAAVSFVLGAFGTGVLKSDLQSELIDLSRNASNILANGLELVNDELERLADRKNAQGGRRIGVKLTSIEPKPESVPVPKPRPGR